MQANAGGTERAQCLRLRWCCARECVCVCVQVSSERIALIEKPFPKQPSGRLCLAHVTFKNSGARRGVSSGNWTWSIHRLIWIIGGQPVPARVCKRSKRAADPPVAVRDVRRTFESANGQSDAASQPIQCSNDRIQSASEATRSPCNHLQTSPPARLNGLKLIRG